MARGKKLKYRDVVGKKQQKSSKKKIYQHSQHSKKTYSLYKNKKYEKSKIKTKGNILSTKHSKMDKNPLENKVIKKDEESETEEEISDLKQLQATFNKIQREKNNFADSDVSDEEIKEKNNSISYTNIEKDSNVNNDVDMIEINSDSELITEEYDIETQKEDEEIDKSVDPFVKHLFYDLHENLLKCLQLNPVKVKDYLVEWPNLGKILIQIPEYVKEEEETKKYSIEGVKKFAPNGCIPNKIDIKNFKWKDLSVKEQIIENLFKANNKCNINPFQLELFSIINNYQDLYYSKRNFNNSEEIRFIYCLHVVNHILKTRTKILHHNARLSKKDQVPDEYRDQGLVRPKVLIIVPFKDSAYKIIKMIIDILLNENKGNVINKKRFIEEYTGNELIMPKKNPKPDDYQLIFSGNISDDFKIGLTITKKSLKLYTNFYSSDIIIASPLGLRTVIGAEGEADRDFDFLSSLELLILDQTEIFLMQNWDHLNHLLNHLHLQPKDSHGTDFSRIRNWCLNGWAKYYRQTLIFSSLMLPEINSIFNKKCINFAGKVKVLNNIEFGSISQIVVQLPHVFSKFHANNITDSIEERFNFFINKILPQQKESLMKSTLIYVTSYFDYVRLRNYLKKEDNSFVQICEYSKDTKIARARDMFFHGDAHFLLYTERYHFFNRIRLKGIRHIIFYQLPNFPHFYYEICNLMQEANMNRKVGNISNMSVTIIYSKYDIHQLAGIVGSERAYKMIQSDRNVHMMVTGSNK